MNFSMRKFSDTLFTLLSLYLYIYNLNCPTEKKFLQQYKILFFLPFKWFFFICGYLQEFYN
jgi:hypothetical protein